jgi:heat shock protein HslJ
VRLARLLAGAGASMLWACAAAPGAPAAPAESGPPALAGTRWVGVVEASTDRRSVPRLEFVGEGRLTGFTGCNLLNGTWRLSGGQALLGPVATTKRLCLGPAGEMEVRVLGVLADGTRITREGAKLVLVGAQGARFELEAAPAAY